MGMSKLEQAFLTPLYWQQFEDLTQLVAQTVFNIPFADKIGRPGYAQHGVDVFAAVGTKAYGIQCKRRDEMDENNDPKPGGAVSEALLLGALADAEAFSPKLDLFILATTAKREPKIHQISRELNRERILAGKSGVKIWFWDDFVTFLNLFDPLERHYYDKIIEIRSPDDQDRKILELIGLAFRRPAFTDPLQREHGESFRTALADTVHALNNGELIERRSRDLIRKTFGGRNSVSNQDLRDGLDLLDLDLAALRETLAAGAKRGDITEQNGYLDIRNGALAAYIDDQRTACIDRLNALLGQAGLPRI